MDLIVRKLDAGWQASWGERTYRCAIGRGGLIAAEEKREGDGATPIGRWTMRRLLYRPDRGGRPATALTTLALTRDDGWCDDPGHAGYNHAVKLPFGGHHETLWREDELYDLIVVLAHNDDPAVPERGSAIFLHCAKPGYPPTAGCIALARADLEQMLAEVTPGDAVRVESAT
jgi:L,D-peptidoglycan transpeptidase YkuD (ErfK/YbiS/YcfS/YnhG family)